MVVNIKLSEYTPCRDVGEILSPEDLGRIENFLKKNHLQEAFKITPYLLQATSWVGVVRCGQVQIQVLPKMIEFIGDSVVVTHNTDFDVTWLKYNYEKY